MPGPGYEVDITTVFPREKPGPLVQAASSIPVLTGNRKIVNLLRNTKCQTECASPFNLAPIPRQPLTVAKNCTVGFDTVTVAVLNIRSLAGKSFFNTCFYHQTQSYFYVFK